ncbi:CBS domain-containing protein [bacterium]|nr:MAG: CBS domain-containing protein [bacterium]
MKTARDLMTREVHTVTPNTGLKELAKLFAEKRVGGFPVVEAGRVVGVVTESDLIHRDERIHIPTFFTLFDAVLPLGGEKKFEEEMRKMAATTVAEIMTQDPIVLSPDATLTQMATAMGEKGVHTLPVVDAEGKLVGVVGKLDLIRAMV